MSRLSTRIQGPRKMKQTLRSRFFRLLAAGTTVPVLALGCATSTGAPPEVTAAPEMDPTLEAPIMMPAIEAPAMPAVPGIDLDTVRAGQFDNGKMWTFEYPPLDYFQETYGFQPDSAWFARARLGALRLPNCTASFVSPNGLVMTNHHCGRGSGSQVSRPGENILDNGFYAGSLADERRVDGLYVDQLIAIEDVSAEVESRLAAATTDAERAQANRQVSSEIEARMVEQFGGKEAGIEVEIIALWNGAKTSAYVFKRYTDVRLVMIPELQMGYYGGDSDNFTYPRYVLDVSFFRVYDDDGEPHQPEHFFRWSSAGVSEDDAVFVIGNPGSTSRLETVAQLEFRRVVQDKGILDLVSSRAAAMQAFYDENPEVGEAMDLRNTIFGLLNTEKLYEGRWAALNDPVIMAKRRDAERSFGEAIDRDPTLQAEFGGMLEKMAQIQDAKLEYAADYAAFLAIVSDNFSSATLRRAYFGWFYLAQQAAGAPAEVLENLGGRLRAVGAQPTSLQQRLLAARIADLAQHLGAQDEQVAQFLGGRTPDAVARDILARSELADSASAADCIDAGTLTMDDPAIQLVSTFAERFGRFQGAFSALAEQEAAVARSLGRARFSVYGTTIPPDATFSLRIADGIVRGYEYNGTIAPIYTTFYGLYDHYYSYGPGTEWDLPPRWLDRPASFDLSTPFNFVATADIIGGNSGSPVLNSNLEVVGLVFDGNIESLPGDYIYLPERNRSVSVDARGILEALDEIYDADRIALELTTGRMFSTEVEADAARR